MSHIKKLAKYYFTNAYKNNDELTLHVKTCVHTEFSSYDEYNFLPKDPTIEIGTIVISRDDSVSKLVDLIQKNILQGSSLGEDELIVNYRVIFNEHSYNLHDHHNDSITIRDTLLENNDNVYIEIWNDTAGGKESFWSNIRKKISNYKTGSNKNYPFTKETIERAIDKGYYDIVEFLRIFKCPWSEDSRKKYIDQIVLNKY
jgi:hypothetical protein